MRKILAFAALAAALALLIGGALTRHQVVKYVRGRNIAKPKARHLVQINDLQLLEDSTFSGVLRRANGFLYSTYDRTKPRVKKACPT